MIVYEKYYLQTFIFHSLKFYLKRILKAIVIYKIIKLLKQFKLTKILSLIWYIKNRLCSGMFAIGR